MSRALRFLGLVPTATLAEVKAAWRALAAEHHPDRGGDPDTFDQYRKAYDEAVDELNQPVPCPTCRGTRQITIASGFTSIKLPCERCGGEGELPREP